jgi:hypothetical protein
LLRSTAKCLPFLRAIDAVEADTFGVIIVQDFDGLAIEDGDYGARVVRSHSVPDMMRRTAVMTRHVCMVTSALP